MRRVRYRPDFNLRLWVRGPITAMLVAALFAFLGCWDCRNRPHLF